MEGKIIVFGSYFTDLTVRTEFLPLPGETVKGVSFKAGPGGKGSNQAVAAHRAGANVTMVSRVGNDIYGNMALNFYKDENMDISNIYVDEVHETGMALITVDNASGQNQIVIVSGTCDYFTAGDTKKTVDMLDKNCILLVQLETNMEATEEIIKMADAKDCTIILNPAPAQELNKEILSCVDIITPNETEVYAMTGVDVTNADPMMLNKAAEVFFTKGVQKVIITLGSKGAYSNDGKTEMLTPSFAFGKVIDTTGAGDAFNGAFAAALSNKLEFSEAVKYATVASGLSVTKLGTAPSMPYKKEIEQVYRKFKLTEK